MYVDVCRRDGETYGSQLLWNIYVYIYKKPSISQITGVHVHQHPLHTHLDIFVSKHPHEAPLCRDTLL